MPVYGLWCPEWAQTTGDVLLAEPELGQMVLHRAPCQPSTCMCRHAGPICMHRLCIARAPSGCFLCCLLKSKHKGSSVGMVMSVLQNTRRPRRCTHTCRHMYSRTCICTRQRSTNMHLRSWAQAKDAIMHAETHIGTLMHADTSTRMHAHPHIHALTQAPTRANISTHVRTCRQDTCTHMQGTVTTMHAHDTHTHPGTHCMHAHMHTHKYTRFQAPPHTSTCNCRQTTRRAQTYRPTQQHRHKHIPGHTNIFHTQTNSYITGTQTQTQRHRDCHKYAHTHRCNSTPACMCLNMSTHNRHGLAAICFALCARLCHSRAGMACRPDYPVMSRLISGA